MPFFLLSRDEDDNLRLLTDAALPTRQDALAALSRLTAEPGFQAWDDSVLLVDLDSALPVLLVRQAESTSVVEQEIVVVQAPVSQDSWEPQALSDAESEPVAASFGTAAAEPDADSPALIDSVAVIPVQEAEAFASYVSAAVEDDYSASTLDQAADDDAVLAGAFLPVPELAMELEPEVPTVDPFFDSSSIEDPEVASETDVQPDSEPEKSEPEFDLLPVGFEPAAIVSEEVPAPDFPSGQPEDTGDGDLRDALVRTTIAMEEESVAPEAVEPLPVDGAAEKWPWDVASAQPAVGVAEPLGALTADDDLQSAFLVPTASMAEMPAVVEPAGELPEEPAKVSEFLMDLEPISAAAELVLAEPVAPEPVAHEPFAAEPVAPEPVATEPLLPEPVSAETQPDLPSDPEPPIESASVDSYVCADCVYVDTCPNKDQRLPKDCGSFQWK